MVVRTLVVWCPDWPVTASGRGSEEPVAVLFSKRVVAASARARANGVSPGQRRREAQSLCPSLVVLSRDLAGESRAFEPVVSAVEGICPQVEVHAPGLCAIPTRGPSRYFGGEQGLVSEVSLALSLLGERQGWGGEWWKVGVADGPFAATLAARSGEVVPPGRSRLYLAPLPIESIGRGDLSGVLRRLGVSTLGAFAALPEMEVLARFGAEGHRCQLLAAGADERPLHPRAPLQDLSVSVELDPPVEQLDQASFVARTLAEEVLGRLRRDGLCCSCVHIEVQTATGETRSRRWAHDRPFDASTMVERVRWQLEGWLSEGTAPTGGLTVVRLLPEGIGTDGVYQGDLFSHGVEPDARASRAMARVQGMLGRHAVSVAALQGGRAPQERVRMVPWGEPLPEPTHSHPEVPSWPGRLPAPSPTIFLESSASEVELLDEGRKMVSVDARGSCSGTPRWLAVAGCSPQKVVSWAGPWPTDERWWDSNERRRRARVQVLLDDGTAHLLVLEGGRWGIEASYD